MRKTVIILATVAAFDLGVMVVAAQARPVQDPPTARREATTTPSGTRDCTDPRPSAPGPSAPCPAGPAMAPTWPPQLPEVISVNDAPIYQKLDRVNTARACVARRGDVVVHDGVRQCRLPAAGILVTGGPTGGRAGGILPPRN